MAGKTTKSSKKSTKPKQTKNTEPKQEDPRRLPADVVDAFFKDVDATLDKWAVATLKQKIADPSEVEGVSDKILAMAATEWRDRLSFLLLFRTPSNVRQAWKNRKRN